MSRMVLFGEVDANADLLRDNAVREALRQALGESAAGPGEVPGAAVESGLLVRGRDRWEHGDRVLVLGRTDEVRRRAEQVAQLITRRLPELRRAAAASVAGPDWAVDGLLVVGGLLLDLSVGQSLREAGHCGHTAGGWRAWVLPPAPVSVGMRTDHLAAERFGAAVMWILGQESPPMPGGSELSALAALHSGRRVDGAASLALRYRGWLHRDRPVALEVAEDGPLDRLVRELAADAVELAYRPLFARLPFDPSDERRLMASRLVMEHALTLLTQQGELTQADASTRQHLVWHGEQWLIAAEVGQRS
jgi:hypothetical protein